VKENQESFEMFWNILIFLKMESSNSINYYWLHMGWSHPLCYRYLLNIANPWTFGDHVFHMIYGSSRHPSHFWCLQVSSTNNLLQFIECFVLLILEKICIWFLAKGNTFMLQIFKYFFKKIQKNLVKSIPLQCKICITTTTQKINK
jgi:hypothetical protein